MKLQYLGPMHLPHHFVGFSRFDTTKNISNDEWRNTASKVVHLSHPSIRFMIGETVGKENCSPCCGEIREVIYAFDPTEVGVGLCKLPPITACKESMVLRGKMAKINEFAVEWVSRFADGDTTLVRMKLIKEGVLPIPDSLTLRDRCNMVAIDFPKEARSELPRSLQRDLLDLESAILV